MPEFGLPSPDVSIRLLPVSLPVALAECYTLKVSRSKRRQKSRRARGVAPAPKIMGLEPFQFMLAVMAVLGLTAVIANAFMH